MYNKKRKFNFVAMFMAFVMLFTFLVPLVAQNAQAKEEQQIIYNSYGIEIIATGSEAKYFGSKYAVRKVAEINEDGTQVTLDEPIVTEFITKQDETRENKHYAGFIPAENNSVYEIQLVEAAEGLVGDTDKVYTFEFPVVKEDGTPSEQKHYTYIEKLERDKFDITIKKVDDSNTVLSNVLFEFNGKEYLTDEKGEIHIEGLEMGEYELVEKETLDGYTKVDDTIMVDLDYDATKEKQVIVVTNSDKVSVDKSVITVVNDKIKEAPPKEEPPKEEPPKEEKDKVKTMDIKSKETIIPIVLVVLLLVLAVGYFIVKRKDDKDKQ